MIKYIVRLTNEGITWYLRATTWTSEVERASTFDTPELASAALVAAKKFMPRKSLAKLAKVITLDAAKVNNWGL